MFNNNKVTTSSFDTSEEDYRKTIQEVSNKNIEKVENVCIPDPAYRNI